MHKAEINIGLLFLFYQNGNNRLLQVTDAVLPGVASGDIDGQPDYDDYTYDELGNLTGNKQDNIDKITWTPSGKVSTITRNAGSLPNIEFAYDPTGNRIMKIVKPQSNGTEGQPSEWSYTYYVRDAQGNQLATYQKTGEAATDLTLADLSLFGSDRLGTLTVDQTLSSLSFTQPMAYSQSKKQYELKNHLGNVLATVSGFKNPTTNTAEVLAAQDYYPFGSIMPGRSFESGYRFGFNGKETDPEWAGSKGATYDYGFRIYDSRIAKFLSVDPLTKDYPWFTPYQFAGNSPVANLDLDGLENIFYGNVPKLSGFSSSNALRLSTDEGIKTEINIWKTENAKIKHDVYIVALDAKSFSSMSETGIAATQSFSNSHLTKDGKFSAYDRNGTEKLNLNNGTFEPISNLDFSKSLDGDKVISVVFVNKEKFEASNQEVQAFTIHHEIESHIIPRIGKEGDIYKNNEKADHKASHGNETEISPLLGQEQPNTPQAKFNEQMQKSYENTKNDGTKKNK